MNRKTFEELLEKAISSDDEKKLEKMATPDFLEDEYYKKLLFKALLSNPNLSIKAICFILTSEDSNEEVLLTVLTRPEIVEIAKAYANTGTSTFLTRNYFNRVVIKEVTTLANKRDDSDLTLAAMQLLGKRPKTIKQWRKVLQNKIKRFIGEDEGIREERPIGTTSRPPRQIGQPPSWVLRAGTPGHSRVRKPYRRDKKPSPDHEEHL